MLSYFCEQTVNASENMQQSEAWIWESGQGSLLSEYLVSFHEVCELKTKCWSQAESSEIRGHHTAWSSATEMETCWCILAGGTELCLFKGDLESSS